MIIGSLLLLVTLAALLQTCLERYERGRTFDMWRIWVAAVVVVVTYQSPAIAHYLSRLLVGNPPALKFLADTRGEMIGLILWFPTIFAVQLFVYRVFLKDTKGETLSIRSSMWLAAVPTLFGLALWLLILVAVGTLFLVIAE